MSRKSRKGLSGAMMAGIAAGVAVVGAVLVGGVYLLMRASASQSQSEPSAPVTVVVEGGGSAASPASQGLVGDVVEWFLPGQDGRGFFANLGIGRNRERGSDGGE